MSTVWLSIILTIKILIVDSLFVNGFDYQNFQCQHYICPHFYCWKFYWRYYICRHAHSTMSICSKHLCVPSEKDKLPPKHLTCMQKKTCLHCCLLRPTIRIWLFIKVQACRLVCEAWHSITRLLQGTKQVVIIHLSCMWWQQILISPCDS